MALFIGTFGTQYGRVEHPLMPGITGNHYVRVVAGNLDEAHQLMNQAFDQAWAFITPAEEYSARDLEKFYPSGCYGTLSLLGGSPVITNN